MKHLLIVFSVLALLISCSPTNNQESKIKRKLERIDKQMYDNSNAALDSLIKIDVSNSSQNNKTYYNLLCAIAENETFKSFKHYSLITECLKWYKDENDHYNYCRSALYKGISLYNLKNADTTAYSHLKKSEELFNEYDFSDKILKSRIYLYLGKINREKRMYLEAESYLLRTLDICTSLKRAEDEQYTRIELFWTYLAQNRYKDALENIIQFEGIETLSPEIQYSLYNALAGYYSAKREYGLSVEYVKKVLGLNEEESLKSDRPKLYFTVSSYYDKSGLADSALHYGKLAVSSIRDSSSSINPFYYKYLADLYTNKGDFYNAFLNYKSAYVFSQNHISKIRQDNVLEIEKKYETSHLKTQLSSSKHYTTFFLTCTLLLLFISMGITAFLSIRLRQCKARVKDAEEIKKELDKCKLINELLLIPAELLTEFTDEVYNQACISRKLSGEVFDNLNKSIDSVRSKSKNKLSVIANSEVILKEYSELSTLSDLSDLEKIIFVLINYGYSSQDIAKILSTSAPRIRAIKAKLKEKIR